MLTIGPNLEASEKKLRKQCNDYFDEAKDGLRDRREKWKNHYNYWCNTKISAKRPRFKSTTRINYCWIVTQVKIPIIMASNPTVNYIPYEDKEDARKNGEMLSKTVGRYLYHKLHFREKLVNAILDSEIYDAGFLKVGFDPEANYGEGEVFVEPMDIFKMFPDPLGRTLKQGRFVCHLDIYPVETLKLKYPQYAKYIKEDPGASELIYESRKWQERSPRVQVFTSDAKVKTPRAFLKEHWISPEMCNQGTKNDKGEPLYKYGRLVTMLNDKLPLSDRPYVYEHGGPPYVKIVSNIVSNEFWGMGDIEQIIPLNDTLNHRIQQFEDIANKCANLGWTVHPNAGKKAIKQLETKGMMPGLLKVIPPEMIKPDTAPQIPEAIFNEIQQLMIMIERVSGISDIMQGRGDVRQRTARGIERLFEAGSSRISLSVKNFEDGYSELAYQVGSLVQQCYGEDRKIVIASGGEALDRFTIGPDNLRDKFEISIDSAAALPQDKQSKAELAFTLLQNHIFELAMSDDPKMKQIAKTMLDVVEFPNREALLNFQEKAMMPQGGYAQMPQFAGIPVLSPEAQEMAAAAGVTPEALAQMVQQGITPGQMPA